MVVTKADGLTLTACTSYIIIKGFSSSESFLTRLPEVSSFCKIYERPSRASSTSADERLEAEMEKFR